MESLKIGDRIRVRNTFNDYVVEVIKLTKTQAIAKTPFDNKVKFKLEYHSSPTKVPREKYSTTYYTILNPKS